LSRPSGKFCPTVPKNRPARVAVRPRAALTRESLLLESSRVAARPAAVAARHEEERMEKECACANRYADVDDLGPMDEIMEKYGHEKGALIPLLQEAQDAYGYLDEQIMRELARRAGYQLSQLYGVATFFSQFRLKPIGEYLIKVCHGTACHVGGATQISDEVCNQLGIKEGETTPDNKFTLESVMCLGACALAPIMVVGEDTHGKLKPTGIKKILKKYADIAGSTEEEE
jgi:NADH-quinone oxidoreductase subunit E